MADRPPLSSFLLPAPGGDRPPLSSFLLQQEDAEKKRREEEERRRLREIWQARLDAAKAEAAADPVPEDPGVWGPALRRGADAAAGFTVGLAERASALPWNRNLPWAIPEGTRAAMLENLEAEREASLLHGNANARAAILGGAELTGGAAGGAVPGLGIGRAVRAATATRGLANVAKGAGLGAAEGAVQGLGETAGQDLRTQALGVGLGAALGGLGAGAGAAPVGRLNPDLRPRPTAALGTGGAARVVDPELAGLADASLRIGTEPERAASGIVVALKDKDGRVYTGRPGETHADLYQRHLDIDLADDGDGFADLGSGDYLTREQAAARVRAKEPLHADTLDAIEREGAPPATTRAPAAERPPLDSFLAPSPRAKARTPDGAEVDVEYRLIDAADLEPSHLLRNGELAPNPRYRGVQPRDRDRVASFLQVDEIARQPDPGRLLDHPDADRGAPIVEFRDGKLPTYHVLSGNARSAGIRGAYEMGGGGAARLADATERRAKELGAAGSHRGRPVLVRVVRGNVDRQRFAEAANASSSAAHSATEQAAIDGGRLSIDSLARFVPNDRGEIVTAHNRDFVAQVLGEIAPSAGEQNALRDAAGELSQEGMRRIQAAVLARAYPDADLVGRIVESTDDNIRNAGKSMLTTAPRFAMLRARMAEGTAFPELDLAGDVAQAGAKLSELRSQRMPTDSWLAQVELAPSTTPEAREIVRMMHESRRSPKRLSMILHRYTELVEEQGNPGQAGLFGPAAPPPKAELLRRAEADYLNAGQRAIFDSDAAIEVPTAEGGSITFGVPVDRAGITQRTRNLLGRWFSTHGRWQAVNAADETGGKSWRGSRWAAREERPGPTGDIRGVTDPNVPRTLAEKMSDEIHTAAAGVRAHELKADQVIRDIKAAAARYHAELAASGRKRTREDVLDHLYAAFQDGETLDHLPDYVQRAISRARQHTDALSDEVLERMGYSLSDDLRETIRRNRGKWSRRDYEVFHNVEWPKLVKTKGSPEHWRWERYREWAAETHPEWAPDDIERYGNRLLHRDPEFFMGIGNKTYVPRLNLGSMKRRLDLPRELRDLLGEYRDPTVAYKNSVLHVAHDLEMFKALEGIKKHGQGRVFFTEQMPGPPEFHVKLPDSKGLGPMAGMVTSPEVAQVIEGALNRARDSSALVRGYLAAVSFTKGGMTVGNFPQTHARNFGSWGLIHLARGDVVGAWAAMSGLATKTGATLAAVPGSGKLAALAQGTALMGSRRGRRALATVAASKVSLEGPLMQAAQRVMDKVTLADGSTLGSKVRASHAYFQERAVDLVKRGVMGESTYAGDVRSYRDAFGNLKSLKSHANDRTIRGAARAWKALEWMYGSEDDLNKIIAYESEVRNLEWALGGEVSRAEIEDMAASRIRDTTPTYSKAGEAVRVLRESPFIAAFPTFYAEMWRTTKNAVLYAVRDLAHPSAKMRMLGARRMAGLLAAATVPSAIAAWSRAELGVGEEEEDALREHVAPWERQSTLVITGMENGNVEFFDLSFLNPYAAILDPLRQITASGTWDEGVAAGLIDTALSAAEPFVTKEILVDGVLDYVVKNDGKLWPKNASLEQKAKAVATAFYTTMAPGVIKAIERGIRANQPEVEESLRRRGEDELADFVRTHLNQMTRWGRRYNPEHEALALAGPRMREIDVAGSLFYTGRTLQDEFVSARKPVRDLEGHPGGMPPAAIVKARQEADARWQRSWADADREVRAARLLLERQGFDQYAINKRIKAKLLEGGLSESAASDLVWGRYRPLKWQKSRR